MFSKKFLLAKLGKSSFWLQKLGVDLYMGSTNTLVNTVQGVCGCRFLAADVCQENKTALS